MNSGSWGSGTPAGEQGGTPSGDEVTSASGVLTSVDGPCGSGPSTIKGCSFANCTNRHKARGYCESHYSQIRRGRAPSPLRQVVFGGTLADRIALRTDRSGDCWHWTGAKDRDGYGLIHTDEGTRGVHRVAFMLAVGPIPEGHQVDHLCHTRDCVRPEHLQAVTPAQNAENRRMPSTNTSGAVGVSLSKGRWRTRVGHDGRTFTAGEFDSLASAADAARRLRNGLHVNNRADRRAS